MSHPITSADIAELLEVIGKPEAARAVMWSSRRTEPTTVELADELEEANRELLDTQDDLDRLEAGLCKPCAKKWRDER